MCGRLTKVCGVHTVTSYSLLRSPARTNRTVIWDMTLQNTMVELDVVNEKMVTKTYHMRTAICIAVVMIGIRPGVVAG